MKTYILDFGTTNTTIYQVNEGIVLYEPTCVIVENGFAVYSGNEAKKQEGLMPIEVLFPVRAGIVVDVKVAESLLVRFFEKVEKPKRAKIKALIPCGISSSNKDDLVSILKNVGFNSIELVDSVIATHKYVSPSELSMIVDMGGGKTDIAIVYDNVIIEGGTLPFGGNNIDASIVSSIMEEFGIQISLKEAENIKKTLGSFEFSDKSTMLVVGIDLVRRVERTVLVSAELVLNIIKYCFDEVVQHIKYIKSQANSDVLSSLQTGKCYLVGGLTKLAFISSYMSKKLNMNCEIKNTFFSPIFGAGVE